jgi:uncharacterized membrane protein
MRRFHPPTVHFPIAFLSFASLGDLAGLRWGWAGQLANTLLVLGLLMALLTAGTGLLDLRRVPPDPSPVARVADRHLMLALLTWASYAASLALRVQERSLVLPGSAALALSLLGLLLLLATGSWGGKLVYEHRV